MKNAACAMAPIVNSLEIHESAYHAGNGIAFAICRGMKGTTTFTAESFTTGERFSSHETISSPAVFPFNRTSFAAKAIYFVADVITFAELVITFGTDVITFGMKAIDFVTKAHSFVTEERCS